MAVIRCPNCGKPNPDFLEVCQYCEAPLHGGPAQPAAGGAFTTQPAAGAGASLATTQPAAGGQAGASAPEAPAAPLGSAPQVPRAADDTLVPPTRKAVTPEAAPEGAPAAEPEADAEPLSWLERLRAKNAAESAPAARTSPADEPDWMWTGQPGEQPAAGGTQPDSSTGGEDPASRLPVWLRGLNLEDEPSGPTSFQVGTRRLTESKADEQTTGTPAAADDTLVPRPRKKMTDRLKDLGIAPPAADLGSAPPAAGATPSAPSIGAPSIGAPSGAPSTAGVTPSAPPTTPSTTPTPPATPNTDADMPDWLKAITSATPPAARSAEPPKTVEPPPQPSTAGVTPSAPPALSLIHI